MLSHILQRIAIMPIIVGTPIVSTMLRKVFVMNHVQALTRQTQNRGALPVKPLRLLLLGTAGTGKTTMVQTALQEMMRHLSRST